MKIYAKFHTIIFYDMQMSQNTILIVILHTNVYFFSKQYEKTTETDLL